jgi:hypothetical protein
LQACSNAADDTLPTNKLFKKFFLSMILPPD